MPKSTHLRMTAAIPWRVGAGLLCSLIFILVGLLVTLGSISVSAASDNATINVNINDGITIRILDSTASSELEELAFDFVPTDAGVSTTKNAVVEVATSNETGYKLYIQSDWREDNTSSTGAYKDNPDGTGIGSTAPHTTSLIHSGATSIPAVMDKIPTNLGTSYPYWYYYNDFYSEDKVIPAFGNPDKLAESENPTDGNYTTVPITVGVDTSIVAGTYRNKLVFTAVSNPLIIDYHVNFDANNDGAESTSTTGAVTQVPSALSSSTTASQVSFTMPKEMPYNNGNKVFLGWSETKDGKTEDGSSSVLYRPGDTYVDIAETTSGDDNKTLYAVWGTPTFWNINYMQEMTTSLCASVYKPSNGTGSSMKAVETAEAYSSVTTAGTVNVPQRILYDVRDLNSYTIRKLADDNCWMTENLAYELYANGTYIGVVNATGEETTFETGDACTPGGDCIINGDTIYDNTYGHYYYSWYAATAGSGTRSQSAYTEAPMSVCPKNWRMPSDYVITAYRNKSWSSLTKAYLGFTENTRTTTGQTTLMSFPLDFSTTGFIQYGEFKFNDGRSCWWSTTTHGSLNTDAKYLYTDASEVNPQHAGWKLNGNAVRCVAL